MSNLQINTRVRRLFYYLEDFEKGLIRIPLFQRDVTWKISQKLRLFDSIKNGYPIGSILFWRPTEDENLLNTDFELKSIGSFYMSERANDFLYILDGYQRLSTLFGCLIDPEKTMLERDDEEWKKQFNIIYNLDTDKFDYNKKKNSELEFYKIPLYKLVDGKEFYNFQQILYSKNLDDSTLKRYLKNYQDTGYKFTDYQIPSIDLRGGDIQESIEIFNRVNSEGSTISDEWKLSAMTINSDFRLGSLISITLEQIQRYNFYDKRKKHESFRELIYRCIQSSFGFLYLDNSKTDVLSLSKQSGFKDEVNKTLSNAVNVVEFLIREFYITDLKFLPANIHFIFLVEFFNISGSPDSQNLIKLKKWFWTTTYSNYFTVYNPAKRKTAFEHFRQFAFHHIETPLFIDKDLSKLKTEKFPKMIDFGGVRKIALALFMINHSVNEDNILEGKSNFNMFGRGVVEFKLFKNEKSTENVIFLVVDEIEDLEKMLFKTKDLSFLLKQEYKGQFSKLFINDKMREAYSDQNFKKVLELRHNLILEKERNFVESLGVQYTD